MQYTMFKLWRKPYSNYAFGLEQLVMLSINSYNLKIWTYFHDQFGYCSQTVGLVWEHPTSWNFTRSLYTLFRIARQFSDPKPPSGWGPREPPVDQGNLPLDIPSLRPFSHVRVLLSLQIKKEVYYLLSELNMLM